MAEYIFFYNGEHTQTIYIMVYNGIFFYNGEHTKTIYKHHVTRFLLLIVTHSMILCLFYFKFGLRYTF